MIASRSARGSRRRDAKARDAYRERIADLDAELDEATAVADVAWAERLAAEREAILDAHPELGRHLEESIATGTFCSYGPPEPVSWRTSTG